MTKQNNEIVAANIVAANIAEKVAKAKQEALWVGGDSKEGVPLYVVTHDGVHHADEVVAIATICLAEANREIRVVRTRDEDVIDVLSSGGCPVVDVGRVDSPEELRFDHHQRGFDRTHWVDGRLLASAGLVWEVYGEDAVLFVADEFPDEENDLNKIGMAGAVATEVEKAFIRPVDLVDTGAERPGQVFGAVTLPGLIGSLNGQEDGFVLAVRSATLFLLACIRQELEKAATARMLRNEVRRLEERMDAGEEDLPVLVLPFFAPGWQKHVVPSPRIQMICFKALDGKWNIQQVPVEEGSPEGRCSLPEAWRGLSGAALQAVLPEEVPPGAVFAHLNGFIGGHATREGALAMARTSLAVKAAQGE